MRGSDFLEKLPSLREWCTTDREVPMGRTEQRQVQLIGPTRTRGGVDKE